MDQSQKVRRLRIGWPQHAALFGTDGDPDAFVQRNFAKLLRVYQHVECCVWCNRERAESVSPAFKTLHPQSPLKSLPPSVRRLKQEKTTCFFFVSIP